VQIVSTEHLAEILIGIARAQAAIVQAAENKGAVVQALEAELQPYRENKNLAQLPVRLLLASLRRTGPDAAALAQELERLCAGPAQPPSPLDQRPTDFNP
jgi:hypothetical protein